MIGLARIAVRTASHDYEVVVGPGAVRELKDVIPSSARRAVVVTQEAVGVAVETGLDQEIAVIPDGEAAKKLSTVEDLCRQFARFGLTRNDVVVAVGGGVVTDVGGFAASVYHRGTRCVNVATTLLGQVDAAIGGKTGVNLPEGKNLVGSFWQPAAVVCDTSVLGSLPLAEMRSGFGEVAKYAFIGAPGLEELPLAEQVARCVALKAAVVAEDEHETSGRRAVLNYGHTLAHALEADALHRAATVGDGADALHRAATVGGEEGDVVRHGEAVAAGLLFAARLARKLGRIGTDRVDYHDRVVAAYGLTEHLPPLGDPHTLVAYMTGDKKSMFAGAKAGLSFVLDGPAGVELVDGIDPALVIETMEEMPQSMPKASGE